MIIDHAGDQSVWSDLIAVCGFSFIGLLVSVRVVFELVPVTGMAFLP